MAKRAQTRSIHALSVGQVARRSGVPLQTIRKALAALPDDKPPTAADWRKLSARWKDELDARIRRLTELRDQLGGCIGCGCMSLKVCPLRNPMDELGRGGVGPRLLESSNDVLVLPEDRR